MNWSGNPRNCYLAVKHPQLEREGYEQKYGVKRYALQKNNESSKVNIRNVARLPPLFNEGISYGNEAGEVRRGSENGKLENKEDRKVEGSDKSDVVNKNKTEGLLQRYIQRKGSEKVDEGEEIDTESKRNFLRGNKKKIIKDYFLWYKPSKNEENREESQAKVRGLSNSLSPAKYPSQNIEIPQKSENLIKPQEEPDDLQKLKSELNERELELVKYQELLSMKGLKSSENPDISSSISKIELDKQLVHDRKKYNSLSLDFQIQEKAREKQLVQEAKEKEQLRRLELLKYMQEQEMKERAERAIKAKEYKETLDYQSKVKNSISSLKKSPQIYKTPEASKLMPLSTSPPSSIFLQTPEKHTKKSQKTLCFDPITGASKDISPYIFGPHPKLSAYIGESRIKNHASSSIQD